MLFTLVYSFMGDDVNQRLEIGYAVVLAVGFSLLPLLMNAVLSVVSLAVMRANFSFSVRLLPLFSFIITSIITTSIYAINAIDVGKQAFDILFMWKYQPLYYVFNITYHLMLYLALNKEIRDE